MMLKPSPMSATDWRDFKRAWLIKYGYNCPDCGIVMHLSHRKTNTRHLATVDHIVAKALGGDDAPHNLRVICRRCNNEVKSRAEQAAADRARATLTKDTEDAR